jgi:antitoxin (DNA-binding transcriptional repressor) of toxin-antitoxin stability system
MKFASIRDVRNQPGLLQSTQSGEPVTLTTNGRPFALVVGLDTGEDPGELEALIRRARAQRSISRIRDRAAAEGLDRLTTEEIDAEISAARAERRA